MVNPLDTWHDHLLNLPSEKQWALANVQLAENGQPLAEAITQGSVHVVSDGLFKD